MSARPRGVAFPAWRGADFIPLIEVLVVIGSPILRRRWLLRDAEFAPGWRGSERLHRMASSGETVSSLRLLDLISDGIQLIDGPIAGVDEDGIRPIVVVRSVRGDEWDVETQDPSAIAALQEYYRAVDLPGA